MPEGDTYAQAARRLRSALVGHPLVAVDGVAAVRSRADRMVGAEVEGVRTHGKHLLVDLSSGLTIHTWLGMPGRWRVYRSGARWHEDRGAARVVLDTGEAVAVCFSAPTVEVERRRVLDHRLRHLGPDILAGDLDLPEVRRRAALADPSTPASTFLLDQRIVAGIGNEYACEALFLEGLHPAIPVGRLPVDRREALIERARRLMLPNARGRGRTTTGYRGRGRESWVYGRGGLPCRRCGSVIASGRIGGDRARVAFWCPRCQAGPEQSDRPWRDPARPASVDGDAREGIE